MGHDIRYLTFPSKCSKESILEECDWVSTEEGDYENQISCNGLRLKDKVLPSYDDAKKWIEENDGWYANLGIKYRHNDKEHWLVKIEFHC